MNRVIDSSGIIICFFFQNYFLFNYMITKIDDHKIKHQLNTEMLIKIIFLKKLNSPDLRTRSTNQTCEHVHGLYKV